MSQLKRVQPGEYQLGALISSNGKVFNCKKGQESMICKQVLVTRKTIKELVDEIDSMKIRLSKAGIYFPECYWEDKQSVYLVYKKFKFSMADLIKQHKRQGQFIPMNKMQVYVSEFTNWLGKIHSTKKTDAHCRIKPSNLFEDEDNECVITDFLAFSNENSELYLPPESITALKKNQSQRFALGNSIAEQLGGDPQKVDVWQLGMSFLLMATLKDITDLTVFRDSNTSDSVKAIEIKELCKKVYGNNFVRLIDRMLQRNPSARCTMSDIDDLVQDFSGENVIIPDENLLFPNPELLLEEVTEKVQLMKQQPLTQFLTKYQLQPMSCKIKATNFWEALEDLGIKVTFKEKGALLALYDLQKTEDLDLSTWVQKQRKTVKLGQLTHAQDQVLSEMMKELNEHLNEHNISLVDFFKAKDTDQIGTLRYEDFDSILQDHNLGLQGDDVVIVKQKYDPEKKNVIYYQQFCDDISSMNQQQMGLSELKKIMYQQIREQHNVFIQFFRTYDDRSKGYLGYDDLNRFLNEIKQHPGPEIMKQLLLALDTENKKQIMFENVRIFFQEFINEDVKEILATVARGLIEIQMTLPQLIRSSTKSASMIAQSQLYNAFKQAADSLKKTDFTFLMNIFGVKEEIEYPQFVLAMVQKGKELKVPNWQQFQEIEVKEKQEKKSAFDDPEQSLHKSIMFNAKQFETQQKLLQFINKQIQERDSTVRQYFKCTFQRMPVTQYREKIRQLQIYKGDFEVEQEELLNNILLAGDKTQVDIDLLIEALLFFKDKKVTQERFNQNGVVMFYEQMNKAMKKKKVTFDDIQDLDSIGDGRLRKKHLAEYLSRQLLLETNTQQFKDFSTSIEEDEQNILLSKLRMGLKLDEAANKLLLDLNAELAYEKSKPEQVFKKYDANKNTKLEIREFFEFLTQLVGTVDQRVAEVLFYKLDQNGDNSINLYEFKQKITTQETDGTEQQQTKYKYKQTAALNTKQLTPQIMKSVFRLRDALKDHHESIDIFDRKGRGQILVNAFQDVIVDFGFDYQDFKGLAQYLASPEDKKFLQSDKLQILMEDCDEAEQLLISLNQTIQNGKVATAQMFYNYDQNGNDTLEKQEFYKLIREIDPLARNKPVDNLFLLLDTNSDGSISISEFKQKVCTKDKPKIMQQGNKQQLSIFDDLMKFLKQSQQMLGEFEIRDEKFSNKLDLDTFQVVLRKNNAPNIQTLELKALAEQLGALQGNMINYKIICLKAKQYQADTTQSRIDAIITKLREQLLASGASIIEIAREFDINSKGRVKVKGIKLGMADKRAQLADEEWDLLLTIIEQDAQDYIDYYALNDLVNLGLEKYKESRKVIVLNTNQEIDKIVVSLCASMEKQVCTLLSLFRQTDKDQDQFVSQDEFMDLLLKVIGYSTTPDIQRQLFDIFDMDKDGKINFTEFEYQVYKRGEITAKQIEEMKLLMLNGRNPMVEQHLSDLFILISQGSQFIEFKQLANYINYYKKYKIIELDQLFRYFDREYSERLDQFRFILAFKQITSNKNIPEQPPYQQPQPLQQPPQQYQTPMGQPPPYNQPQYPPQQQYPQQQQQYPPQTPQQQYPQQQYPQKYPPQIDTGYQQQQGQFVSNPMESQFSPAQQNNQINYPPQNQFQYQKEQPQPQPQQWQQSQQLNQSWQQQQDPQQFPIQQYNPNKQAASLFNNLQPSAPSQSIIPQDFDLSFYDNELHKKCIQKNLDLFDLLCQYDKTALPELKLSNPQDLERAFLFLDIQAPTQHIQQFYYYYSQQTDYMSIVFPYLKMNNPGKLLAKALNFTMVKHTNYTKEMLWGIIGDNQPKWTMASLNKINQNLKIGLNEGELREAYYYWDNIQAGSITYKMYDEILTLNQIVVPGKGNEVTQPKETGLQSTLDTLMLNLSEIVLAKNCFNLFEQADKKGYNQISYNDFLQIAKKLIGAITGEEIKAIKQLLQQNGFINLSDLAKHLKVDRTKTTQFSQDEEKKQFGLAETGQRKSILNAQNQEKFKKIAPIINDFLKKRSKTYEDFALYFFPANAPSTLDRNQFVKKAMDAQFGLTVVQCEDLYDYLDANSSGHISINEFRLVFQIKTSEQTQKKQAENIIMNQDIEQEILELFNQIDENKNQSLDQRELLKALQSVGLNPSTEELAQYFAQFDRDKSGTISYQEFSIIVKDILRKELLQADDLLEDLRREFRQVCNPTTRMLSKEQVSQVFNNMGVQLKPQELEDLFLEIDEDKSGSVDIDEFIYFIQKNQSGMSAKASAAVMNIKGSRRISLHDLKEIFVSLPNNFIMSFIRAQNKKLQNMPSHQLKPILDNCGLFYQGLNYVDAANFNIKQSILDKVNVKNNFSAEIKLIEATGIPIPDEKDVPRNSFIRREIGVILIDKALNRYECNSMYIPATWSIEYEDRWVFESPALEQAMLLKWGNFDEKLDNMSELVFEFITYSVNKNRLIQISCAYGSIPVSQLKPGKQVIELKGGAPQKDITIDKKDIRTNRSGWRSVVKALSSNIKSQLTLEVLKLSPQITQKVLALPNKCMLNKWGLGMQAAFREYFAYRTQARGEIELNLASDIRIKAWLNCFDCPDTARPIGGFWNEFIEPKVNDHQFLLKAVTKVADSLYLMFKNTEFKFSTGDPTARIDHDQVLFKKRQSLVQDAILDIKINLGLVANTQKKQQVLVSLEPLNVEEMMDLDNEQDMMAIEKFLNKKKLRK